MPAPERTTREDSARGDRLRLGALAALGAWTIVVPYLGRAIGLRVDVGASVEIVDHVVPGTLIAAIGTYLALTVRADSAGARRLIGAGICFLAGFWVLATHVPLLSDATQGKEQWGPAIWHSITAVPVVALSLWVLLREA